MIKANFNTYASYVTDSLYQWDLNRVLSVTGLNLTVAPEVHFSNASMDKAIVRQATLLNHIVSVGIPNSLLQEPLTISAHIGIYEGDTFKVVEVISIPVIAKKRPADYQIQGADEEIYSFEALKNAIANMVKLSDFNSNNKVISARIDNIIAHNNDTDGNTELLDVRVDINGNTHKSAGKAIRSQIERLSNDVDSLCKNDYTKSILFNRNIYTVENGVVGKAIHGDTGALVDNANYFTTDFIEVCPQFIMFSNFFSYSTVGLYDENKNFIKRLNWDVKEWNNENAKFVRVTCINTNKDSLYMGYAPYDIEYGEDFKNEIKAIVSEKSFLKQSVICFVDDDATTLFITKTKPILDNFNIKAGIGVITDKVGTNNYLTIDQLIALQDEGYEIMSHSASHDDIYNKELELFDNLDTTYEQDMNISLNYLSKHGLNVNTFVYPRGWFHAGDGKYVDLMARNSKKFYKYAIDNGADFEVTANINPYMIKRIFISDSNGLDYYKSLIDSAKQNVNSLLVFGIHSGQDEISANFLASVINYAINQEVLIMSPQDAFNAKIG